MSPYLFTGPFLTTAVFCEEARQEKGFLSLLHIIDRIAVVGTGPDMPPTALEMTLVVILRSGEFRVFRNDFSFVKGGERFQFGSKLGLGPMAVGEFGQSQLYLTDQSQCALVGSWWDAPSDWNEPIFKLAKRDFFIQVPT
jgi:hypothetical protein